VGVRFFLASLSLIGPLMKNVRRVDALLATCYLFVWPSRRRSCSGHVSPPFFLPLFSLLSVARALFALLPFLCALALPKSKNRQGAHVFGFVLCVCVCVCVLGFLVWLFGFFS